MTQRERGMVCGRNLYKTNQLKHRSSISNTMHDHLWSYFKASAPEKVEPHGGIQQRTQALLAMPRCDFKSCGFSLFLSNPSPWSPFFPSGHRIASEVSFSPCLVTSENCGAWCDPPLVLSLSADISARPMQHQDDPHKLPWLLGCARGSVGFSSEPKRLIQA